MVETMPQNIVKVGNHILGVHSLSTIFAGTYRSSALYVRSLEDSALPQRSHNQGRTMSSLSDIHFQSCVGLWWVLRFSHYRHWICPRRRGGTESLTPARVSSQAFEETSSHWCHALWRLQKYQQRHRSSWCSWCPETDAQLRQPF